MGLGDTGSSNVSSGWVELRNSTTVVQSSIVLVLLSVTWGSQPLLTLLADVFYVQALGYYGLFFMNLLSTGRFASVFFL